MDAALLFFGFLWALLGKGSSSTSSPPYSPPQVPPALPPGQTTSSPPPAPPWPQVVPAGLPSFPQGWEFDEPPPLAVQQRAQQLVQPLWNQGAGSIKAEQTGGRWIVYRAEIVASGKKGIVAYRQKQPAALPPGRPARPQPRATRRRPSTPAAPSSTSSPPAATAPPVVSVPASSVPLKVTTLRKGMGAKPAAPRDDVKLLQSKLGIPQDGRFWNDTEAAVKAYQRANGLDPDGVVGPATWTKLLVVRA
jgi:peptidoglycan hydrolase-like protein with peptidoglycan-binding domain